MTRACPSPGWTAVELGWSWLWVAVLWTTTGLLVSRSVALSVPLDLHAAAFAACAVYWTAAIGARGATWEAGFLGRVAAPVHTAVWATVAVAVYTLARYGDAAFMAGVLRNNAPVRAGVLDTHAYLLGITLLGFGAPLATTLHLVVARVHVYARAPGAFASARAFDAWVAVMSCVATAGGATAVVHMLLTGGGVRLTWIDTATCAAVGIAATALATLLVLAPTAAYRAAPARRKVVARALTVEGRVPFVPVLEHAAHAVIYRQRVTAVTESSE